MSIFLLGASGSAKTPLAKFLSEELGCPFITASAALSHVFQPIQHLKEQDRAAYIKQAASLSVAELQRDPDIVIRYLKRNIDEHRGNVIVDGCRNPRDFAHVFDWRFDTAITLTRDSNPIVPSKFETGLHVIEDYLHWATNTGIMPKSRKVKIDWNGVSALETIVQSVVSRLQK